MYVVYALNGNEFKRVQEFDDLDEAEKFAETEENYIIVIE